MKTVQQSEPKNTSTLFQIFTLFYEKTDNQNDKVELSKFYDFAQEFEKEEIKEYKKDDSEISDRLKTYFSEKFSLDQSYIVFTPKQHIIIPNRFSYLFHNSIIE